MNAPLFTCSIFAKYFCQIYAQCYKTGNEDSSIFTGLTLKCYSTDGKFSTGLGKKITCPGDAQACAKYSSESNINETLVILFHWNHICCMGAVNWVSPHSANHWKTTTVVILNQSQQSQFYTGCASKNGKWFWADISTAQLGPFWYHWKAQSFII